MGAISKTTQNYASKRGLDIVENGDGLISVFEATIDSEPMFLVRGNNGEFFYWGNTYLPRSVKEELPYWMKDEKALRSMLGFVAEQRTPGWANL